MLKFRAFLLVCLLFLYPSPVRAALVINEILSNPSEVNNEWVELYNNGDETVNLSGWYLADQANHKKTLDVLGVISGKEIKVLEGEKDGWLLNNGTETVYLKDNTEKEIDSYSYSQDPGEDKSFARIPDGGNWQTLGISTKASANGNVPSDPSPSGQSPTPSPASIANATCKINDAKDKDGNVLTSVKIYIDNVYTHHYAPQTLTFCDDCQDGKLGSHTIMLEKSNYQNWTETKDFNSASSFEFNPQLVLLESSQAPSLAPSPSVKASVNPSVISSTVLAAQKESTKSVEINLLSPLPSTQSSVLGEKTPEEPQKPILIPAILSSAGLALMGLAYMRRK